jgi:hypothetical protein
MCIILMHRPGYHLYFKKQTSIIEEGVLKLFEMGTCSIKR